MRKKLIYEKNHYIKVSLKRSFLPENIKLFFNYHEIEIKNLKVRTEYSQETLHRWADILTASFKVVLFYQYQHDNELFNEFILRAQSKK